ncbi:c-type cytochrome [Croceicoccus mobilis]|uniref:Cytochrome C n=1 Tax=Croceicoccus mobilis TaxID=1703339 RepID=A0A917DU23_9SPHN|nr:cytochrome c [Croceicoccus mobilis]GGD70452.1 hypothetical protein GCM10010990_19980 [Croceicoccus mobilis]
MNRTSSRTYFRSGLLALSAAALGTIGTMAIAAPSASSAIAQRQAGFKDMGRAMKVLKGQVSGGSIDRAAAVAAARTIAANARTQKTLFPAGSGASSGIATDALNGIWSDRAAFDAQMARLASEADRLVSVAGSGNADALNTQFRATGKVCSTCHRQFRADD